MGWLEAQVDTWDPDTNFETTAANITERDYVAGFNLHISANYVKWQANCMPETCANAVVPSRDVFLTNVQVSW